MIIGKYIIMSVKNLGQDFRLKKIDETINYLIEEINKNQLRSKKDKKCYRVLNFIEHLFLLISTFTGCVSISAFTSLVGITIGITSSAIGLKNCEINAGIKKHNLINKGKKE